MHCTFSTALIDLASRVHRRDQMLSRRSACVDSLGSGMQKLADSIDDRSCSKLLLGGIQVEDDQTPGICRSFL